VAIATGMLLSAETDISRGIKPIPEKPTGTANVSWFQI